MTRSLVGCARMYASSPSLQAAWGTLFAWVSAASRIDLEVIDHAYPAPLDDLWAREDMGRVFMCGYPWALRAERPRLLAGPVPSPARYGGRPVYFTDFVVRAGSRFTTLEDTFGARLAYSIESSHSGYNAPRHHFLAYRTSARPTLYGETVGPLVSPRRVLDAVVEGRADVGPVDSYLFDLWRRHLPELTAAVRVIATTEAAPIPPLVASPMIDEAMCKQLTEALLDAHRDPAATPLDLGLVTRVVPKERLEVEAWSVAERITKASPQAILATRRAVNFNVRHSWDEMVRYEQEVCLQVFAHPDAAEGPRAFTEKREPRFSDR